MRLIKNFTVAMLLLGTFSATAGTYPELKETEGKEIYLDAYLRVTNKKVLPHTTAPSMKNRVKGIMLRHIS